MLRQIGIIALLLYTVVRRADVQGWLPELPSKRRSNACRIFPARGVPHTTPHSISREVWLLPGANRVKFSRNTADGAMMARASDAAYDAIKSWVQKAEVAPGALIDEAEAAKRLNMSRTPVREALLRLQSEGYVEIGRGKGIRVLPLSAGDMREIYQVISGMEVVAVGLLAKKRPSREDLRSLFEATADMNRLLSASQIDQWGEADELFHRELMRLSGNGKLYTVGCHLRDLAKRAHMVAVRLQDDKYRARSTANHTVLVKAILKGNMRDAVDLHFEQRQRGEDALVGIVERFNLASL
jgi:DNA-binding GntR family transcriptional regulator